MTRLSLIFASTFVACVIGLTPQKETGTAFQPAPVKTRSLSAVVPKVEHIRSLGRVCVTREEQTCQSTVRGSTGPRG